MSVDWWTLGLQAINVIVLIWLLAHFFWRPVAAIIAKRNAAAKAILVEAGQKLADAEAAKSQIEQTRAGFAKEHDAILAASQEDVKRIRSEMLEKAKQEVADLHAAGEIALKKEQEGADRVWIEKSSQLAVDIARKLVSRIDERTLQAAFFNDLVAQIRDLPENQRRSAGEDANGLEIVSAAPLEPDVLEDYRTRIQAAFGTKVAIASVVEPPLIAGIELRNPHLLIGNSWRTDLARIRKELSRDTID